MLIVRTDKTVYKPNDTVLITLTLQNTTRTPQAYSFASMQRFDVLIKQDGKKIWQWSEERLFAQVFTKLVIAPGDSRVFKVEWNQVDRHGKRVQPGVYSIQAGIVNYEAERGSTVIEVGELWVTRPASTRDVRIGRQEDRTVADS